ncbi:MAG: hypothetical protein ACFFG0_46245 [Candidatus Thorarchaeota archaeon]
MDKETKKLVIGVVASGIIAPIVSVITVILINKIQEKMKKR